MRKWEGVYWIDDAKISREGRHEYHPPALDRLCGEDTDSARGRACPRLRASPLPERKGIAGDIQNLSWSLKKGLFQPD